MDVGKRGNAIATDLGFRMRSILHATTHDYCQRVFIAVLI